MNDSNNNRTNEMSKRQLMEEKAKKEAKKKLTIKIVASLSGILLPLLLIFFIIFIVVLIASNAFGADSNSTLGGCVGSIDGEVSALFDNSFTQLDFTNRVNSFQAKDIINSKTGKSTKWGYETFFKANAANFYTISVKHGLDPRFLFSLGIIESYWGTSRIALDKGNFFGWNAVDNNPYNGATTFYNMSDGIETVANGLAKGYISQSGWQHQKIKSVGRNPETLKGIFYLYSTAQDEEADEVANMMQQIFGITTTSSSCNGSFSSLSDYGFNIAKAKKVTSPLSDTLINEVNNYIVSEVNKAGYGTGAGVATAGQSLIYGLYQKDYYLPYWFGGGHAPGLTIGLDKRFGLSGGSVDPGYKSYNAVRGRYWYSLDCSGFVSWSIKNACDPSFGAYGSGSFRSFGNGISLSNAKPGDIMSRDGHVRLIVKNNGDGSVIAAESTSGYVSGGAIQFHTYKSAGEYKIVDMSNWYAKNCKKSR